MYKLPQDEMGINGIIIDGEYISHLRFAHDIVLIIAIAAQNI